LELPKGFANFLYSSKLWCKIFFLPGIFNHCFGELGCFSNFGWWAMRPVVRVVLPESPEKIATRFLVNSRAHPNPAKPEVLVYQSLCSSTPDTPDTPNSFGNISKSFNPRLPTKVNSMIRRTMLKHIITN
jgi:hypothetical protein